MLPLLRRGLPLARLLTEYDMLSRCVVGCHNQALGVWCPATCNSAPDGPDDRLGGNTAGGRYSTQHLQHGPIAEWLKDTCEC